MKIYFEPQLHIPRHWIIVKWDGGVFFYTKSGTAIYAKTGCIYLPSPRCYVIRIENSGVDVRMSDEAVSRRADDVVFYVHLKKWFRYHVQYDFPSWYRFDGPEMEES